MTRSLIRMLLVMLLACAGMAHAQAIEPMPFADHAQELRFQHLTQQLRCPMCQNETLADSNAPIARDLRNQIFQMMQHGSSDDEIKQYLVARYSNFVLYDPPLTAGTWLLWFGPLLILLSGGAAVLLAIRKRSQRGTVATEASTDNALIDSTPTDNGDDW
ncbi:cytochrome c biogenesis protein [Rhodanobacter panaciterrae]|uniref:Cytochrome c-type biogenesis protein n=1 Tax=Rhodanobacter panaciterrae TaxID=490572 RepID=A0ABQ2ZNU7_9GAMM|nr:cytochrome c biogenesis protein [Rhodanobacter panaciterrae]